MAWINNGGGSVQNWQNPGDSTTGFPLAELMMGSSHVFQWGNWNISPYGFNEAAYAMDDWKVNRKLTVQIGLRWDHDGARSPKSFAPGQSSPIMYDINAKNVLTAQLKLELEPGYLRNSRIGRSAAAGMADAGRNRARRVAPYSGVSAEKSLHHGLEKFPTAAGDCLRH